MAKLEIPVIVKCTEIDELIDEIKHLQTYKLFEGDEQVLIDRDDTIEIFAKHIRASAQPEQTEQRWIPCSERLPEERQWVLCNCLAGIMDVLRLTNDGCWNKNYPHAEYMSGFVIAWMPLPEPYREEQDDRQRKSHC